MNKLIQITKIALLTIILAEEVRKAIGKRDMKVSLKISNLKDFYKLAESAVLENDIQKLKHFKPTFDLESKC